MSTGTPTLTGSSRVAIDLSWTFGARAFSMLLGLAGNVLSARALGPVDFGRFGLVTAVVTICGTIADMGLTYTAIKFVAQYGGESSGQAGAVARIYFALRLLTGTGVGLLGILLAGPIAGVALDTPSLTPYLQAGFLTLLSLAISSYPSMVLVGLGQFGRLGVASALNAAITVAGIAALFASGNLSLMNLVLWNVVLPLVSTLPSWFLMPSGWLPWKLGKAGHALASSAEMARRMFGFSKWIVFSNVGSIVMAQGDLILLVRLSDPVTVGIYSVALTMAMRLDIVNQSLFTVMMPRASRLRGTQQMRGYLARVLRGSLLLAAGLGVAALLAQPVIGLLYGARYTQAAPLFMALLVVVLFDLVTSSLFLLAFPLDKPRVLAITDWLRVAVLGVAGWLLIPIYGGLGAVAARLLARVTGTTAALSLLGRAIGKSAGDLPAVAEGAEE